MDRDVNKLSSVSMELQSFTGDLQQHWHMSITSSKCVLQQRHLLGYQSRTLSPNPNRRTNPNQWLEWFCEAGGSPDEARLEQTPYPFQPH